MEGPTRKPHDEQIRRVARSVLLLVVLTYGSLLAIDRTFYPPRGNPLLNAVALSWLIALPIAIVTGGIFASVNPGLFSLAPWEKRGRIYDHASVRAFRWVLLHSPLGWINPSIHLLSGRADCDRLLKELNAAEGVHWLLCLASMMLAIAYLVDDYAAYGYSMLLVNIPFNLFPIMLQRRNRGRLCRVLERRRVRTPG